MMTRATAYCCFAFDAGIANHGHNEAKIISVMSLLAPERARLLALINFAPQHQPATS